MDTYKPTLMTYISYVCLTFPDTRTLAFGDAETSSRHRHVVDRGGGGVHGSGRVDSDVLVLGVAAVNTRGGHVLRGLRLGASSFRANRRQSIDAPKASNLGLQANHFSLALFLLRPFNLESVPRALNCLVERRREAYRRGKKSRNGSARRDKITYI